jgi:Uma2 family endonuclease
MSAQITRRHFTVDDLYRMAEAGILTEDDRVELIEGEVVEMSPIGSRHSGCVMRLTTLLTEQLGRSVVVNVQNPVILHEQAGPQPDLAALKPRADFYSESHPTSEDILLIIEVADTSVDYDRHVKIPMYARALIAEVWLIDLTQDVIELYQQPENGAFKQISIIRRGQALASAMLPSLQLNADDILG